MKSSSAGGRLRLVRRACQQRCSVKDRAFVRSRFARAAKLKGHSDWYNPPTLLVPSHYMSETNWLSEPSTASKRIIFARHGEYPCNVRGVCNSNPRTGFYLTEKGEAQARALGERLKDEKIELIVTSEFLRARQTAWLANEVLKVPQVVNRLANENRVGAEFEGKSGDEFQRFIAHAPATTSTPDGEPFTGMLSRIQSLIADLKLSSPHRAGCHTRLDASGSASHPERNQHG